MKRFLWALPTFLLVISASALADSIIIGLNPNDGSGDNFGFIIKSSGLTFGGGGGTPYSSFNDQGYAPGSTFGGDLGVFLNNGNNFAKIGDTSYSDDNVLYSGGSLFLSSFTLPTNGKDFTVQVTADFSAFATIIATGQGFGVSGSGIGTMTFLFSPISGLYYAEPVVFRNTPVAVIPEQATFGLVGTGLLSMLPSARRKLRA